ncbi:type 1 glutamine amidotransferase [Janibacter cremeus]|uniref:GMP synthase-like glutamine amidotransferase n=1 Tax=Janibacter cremeus TaxID=1285192 RepID=A0A852VPT3_9MICO|nr:type 1 glutamine amidotransferase [Janibacter cremeus]NYF97909.1 GMP synthase-like glutamine amidotransferase [Janibacter cremeus]
MAVLVVQHQKTCPPGRVGVWLTEAGVELDVRHPYAGDVLPHDLAGHDGLLVLGGQMGFADDEVAPWLPTTRGLIRTAAKGSLPTLGICLGHQLAASALGGTVGRNPRGRTLGMFSVLGSEGLSTDPVLDAADAAPVVQWNDDIVTELPSRATALATNEHGDLLLARLAPTVWGVQGHPEADHTIVSDWASKDADTHELADVDVPAVLAEIEGAGPAVEAAWRPVAAAFAALLQR